jgi:hypothetical protein
MNPHNISCKPEFVHLVADRLAFACGHESELFVLKQVLECVGAKIIDSRQSVSSRKPSCVSSSSHGINSFKIEDIFVFCHDVSKNISKHGNGLIVFCIEKCDRRRANVCFLLAAYMVLHHNWCPFRASKVLGCCSSSISCTEMLKKNYEIAAACYLSGLSRAAALGWILHPSSLTSHVDGVDVPLPDQIQLINPKFICCKSKISETRDETSDENQINPAMQALGVTCIVRLVELGGSLRFEICFFSFLQGEFIPSLTPRISRQVRYQSPWYQPVRPHRQQFRNSI